jgi:putative membrane protein
MKGIVIRWLVLTAAVFLTSYMLDGIHVSGFMTALEAAAILGILNAVFRPVLIVLTLPINILTLGLFTFIINGFLLMMVSYIIPGFAVNGFWTAFSGSIIISILNWILSSFIIDRGRVEKQADLKGKGNVEKPADYIDLENTNDDKWE